MKRMKHFRPGHLAKPTATVCRGYCRSFRGVYSPMLLWRGHVPGLMTWTQTVGRNMEAAYRIAAHLPNMNVSSISFIRKRGEVLETSLHVLQDPEQDPGPQPLISALFVCCHSVSPVPHNRMGVTCVKWDYADVGCVTYYYTRPHVHTPTRSRHIRCPHPPARVRPGIPPVYAC